MQHILWLDTETFSECDLKAHGTHRYAEHPSTEIIVAQWAVDDGEPNVEDLTGKQRPSGALLSLLGNPNYQIRAHNAVFDRTLIRHCWGLDIPVERWYCTMIQAMAHGLPGALGNIGGVMGLEADAVKDKRGAALIQIFCKPAPKGQKVRRKTGRTHPVEWAEFLEYSRQDVPAMRNISRVVPTWNFRDGHPELAMWHLDQRINDRGFAVDVDLAEAAIEAVAVEQKRLKAEMAEATDGEVANASRRDQLLAYILSEYEVELPDMKADTLRRRMNDPELPEGVKLLISIRLESTKTSTAKYKALVKAVSADGRLRNTLQFAGAQRTMRWAGRIFQPQNMPRPNMSQVDIDEGISDLLARAAPLFWDDVMRLTANTVRGCIVAAPGKKLCIADLANIEGRMLAWLAGEAWKLDAFSAYDAGTGPDLYKLAYARSFNVDPETATGQKRQIGKVQELACFSGDTPVVTSSGIKSLHSVTTEDLLWDGKSWVRHQGLVARGVRRVVPVAGIEVTPDHLIKVGKTWKQAQVLATSESTLCQALATGSENLPLSVLARSRTSFLCSAVAELHRTWSTITTYARAPVRAATRALKSRLTTGEKTSGDTPTCAATTPTGGDFSTEFLRRSLGATAKQVASTTPTAGVASKFLNRGGLIGRLFCRIFSPFMGGIPPSLIWTESTSTSGTFRETYDLFRLGKIGAETSEQCEKCRQEYSSSKPVFDILNSGPNNCFAVLTNRGPLIAHNCGYGGGVAAFLTFAAVYDMDLGELSAAVYATASKEAVANADGMWNWASKKGRTLGLSHGVYTSCEIVKSAWRDAHPMTVALWSNIELAVRKAIGSPGQVFRVRSLAVRVDGAWLRIRLPSGRYLCYLQPQIGKNGEITYMGVSQYTRQWTRLKAYGGKFVEQCTQAAARDVLAESMPLAEAAGYPIVLSVHDELLTETPGTDEFSHTELAEIMSTVPAWAQGLPLSAAGFETNRYRKG